MLHRLAKPSHLFISSGPTWSAVNDLASLLIGAADDAQPHATWLLHHRMWLHLTSCSCVIQSPPKFSVNHCCKASGSSVSHKLTDVVPSLGTTCETETSVKAQETLQTRFGEPGRAARLASGRRAASTSNNVQLARSVCYAG